MKYVGEGELLTKKSYNKIKSGRLQAHSILCCLFLGNNLTSLSILVDRKQNSAEHLGTLQWSQRDSLWELFGVTEKFLA